VLLAGQFTSARFEHEFARDPHTRFVVLDPDPVNGSLYNAVTENRNTSDVFFIEGPGAYQAGYFAALMAQRIAKQRGLPKRSVAVSMIGSYPNVNKNVTCCFGWGATDAVHGIKVLENESYDDTNPAKCERLADNQINEGSLVVFADAGACSAGALGAAGTRSVVGIAADQDPDPSRDSIGAGTLAYTTKNFGQQIDSSIRSYLDHTLQPGHFDIPYTVGAAGFVVTPNPAVPNSIRKALEHVKQLKAKTWAKLGTLK
jgi:basic membrane lipoprotein Med (substrate-binding protein (PBP1-ABC) superfamily)